MKPSELNARIQDGDESARSEKAVIINRVGDKIGRIRDSGKLIGQAFVDFRESLYASPEDDRESAVDAKLLELGL